MRTSCETDLVAWASEQARFLRAGRFELLDRDHLAAKIEDVGTSEQRELASRMSVLLAHLLKGRYQPERRGATRWKKTILAQRKEIAYGLSDTPSLIPKLQETRWLEMVWARSVAQAVGESGLDCSPDACPWAMEEEVLNDGWLPDV